MKKRLFYFIFLLMANLSLEASINEVNAAIKQESRVVDFVLGVSLAFAAHIITERLVVEIHENGHSLVSMLTGGNFGKVYIYNTLTDDSGLGELHPSKLFF